MVSDYTITTYLEEDFFINEKNQIVGLLPFEIDNEDFVAGITQHSDNYYT